jgi:Small, acid-soluble spore proteins, alpha/beta type.
MTKKKVDLKKQVKKLTPEEQLKWEIARELGLYDKVLEDGWRSLSAKESGRIGGILANRKKEMKKQALSNNNESLH